MLPTSTPMRVVDSQESSSSEPPDYASPPLTQLGDDEAPLIVHQKRRLDTDGPRSVDDFARELGRVAYTLKSLEEVVSGLESLKSRLASQETPSSTLEALARRTATASLLLATVLPSLRTLYSTLPYLKPAPGSFVVSNVQTSEMRQKLADCAQTVQKILGRIDQMERSEDNEEKKDARLRLLHFIKKREGAEQETSNFMALLLGAERDGSRAVAEDLEVNSYPWRWVVERPGCRLARCVEEAGDLLFLNRVEYPPASSLWANTWAYLPNIYNAKATNRKTSGYSAAGTKESMPIDASDEELAGNYGEPMSDPTGQTPPRYKLWLLVFFILLILSSSGIGVAYWAKQHQTASISFEGGERYHPLSTIVNMMPAHPTVA